MPKTCTLAARDYIVADGCVQCVQRAAAGSRTSANDV